MINKILFITLSNIGDCLLTLPCLDALRENFPQAKITVLAGPRAKGLFENKTYINKFIIYDKHIRLKRKIRLFSELKLERFDMVIDLRNSLFGALLPCRHKTSFLLTVPKNIRHMKQRHFYRLQEVARGCKRLQEVTDKKSLYISKEDEGYINNILKENGIYEKDKIIVISPGARSHIKRWPQDRFVELIYQLVEEFMTKVILVGDKEDIPITKYIADNSEYPVIDLSGKTSLPQLAYLLNKAQVLLTNDSAALHMASYLDMPIVAIFGPTNEAKYGPWSRNSLAVKKEIFCRPCEKAQCRFGTLKCMQLIKVEDVLRAVRELSLRGLDTAGGKAEAISKDCFARQMKNDGSLAMTKESQPDFKRILIVRTDRIGDVLLSTPVIKALREAYPYSYIAMMVLPYSKDIIDGNPYLDEVIVYDKAAIRRSLKATLKFAHQLRKKRFDVALILHPTNRSHLITFVAGIPKRIGYDRKLSVLLTDKIKHTKQLGEKHESEYALDFVRYLGITPKDTKLTIPIRQESEVWTDELFKQEGIKEDDKILAIHPGASCPSRIWPQDRFAKVSDELAQKYGFKVIIVAGPKDITNAEIVLKNMAQPAINLAGKTSVSQLVSVLKRCQLFISNDSGPVHFASALGIPVIAIFARAQKGLSPKRWGPIGKNSRFLHKADCIKCLAHNCEKDFVCLKAITVDDVVSAADSILAKS